MKDQTVKLSGHAKDRFLERFFAAEPGLDGDVRDRLTARSRSAFSSLRVRKALLAPQRAHVAIKPTKTRPQKPAAEMLMETSPTAAGAPQLAKAGGNLPDQSDAPFDAYEIGLVPIFQREGRDGLMAKLASVTRLDHLRQMAKAQQVVLPQPLRSGDAALDEVRSAIADAVAKRIADRRAAAG